MRFEAQLSELLLISNRSIVACSVRSKREIPDCGEPRRRRLDAISNGSRARSPERSPTRIGGKWIGSPKAIVMVSPDRSRYQAPSILRTARRATGFRIVVESLRGGPSPTPETWLRMTEGGRCAVHLAVRARVEAAFHFATRGWRGLVLSIT